MKKIYGFIFLCIVSISLHASTSITSGTVSGHWTLSGSPYLIYSNITLASDSSLTIDPGVEIIFQGFYGISVLGVLNASGTLSQPILFHVQDTIGWSDTSTAGGWNGVSFSTSSPTSAVTVLNYCNFSDMKRSGILIYYSSLTITNCNFFHNNGSSVYAYIIDSTQVQELAGCTFHDNINGGIFIWNGIVKIHDCKIYNNNTGNDFLYSTGTHIFIENNEFYNNTQHDTTLAATIEFIDCNGIISGNKIHHNTSLLDGALCVTDGIVDISSNLICNNQSTIGYIGSSACGSTQGGGGIRISGEYAAIPTYFTVRNNIIANNYAGLQGGGIDVFWASATIANNNIVNNSGLYGGGIFIFNCPSTSGVTSVIIKNNILKNNYTQSGGFYSNVNLYIQYGDTIKYEKNWTDNTFYHDHYEAAPYFQTGDTLLNIVGTDPKLTDPTISYDVTENAVTKNFSLMSTSACIDAGDIAFASPLATDYIGNVRIFGSSIDIGAYEYGSYPENIYYGTNKSKNSFLRMYPNPANDILIVETPQPTGNILIYNSNGMKISDLTITNTTTTIDIALLPKGTYFAFLVENNIVSGTEKFAIR